MRISCGINRFIASLYQDISNIHYTPELFTKNRVVGVARRALKLRGITGLHQAPCFRGMLQRLPSMLQEQYLHEKVVCIESKTDLKKLLQFCMNSLHELLYMLTFFRFVI